MRKMKVTYYDPNGKKSDGYIKDGKTYTDENFTQRVPVGSTVETAGGTYKMTESGGVPTYQTAQNNYKNKTQEHIAAYEGAARAREEAINAATTAAIERLNAQKKQADVNYTEANREAQAAYISASNPYGAAEEQRAKIGLADSGYAESSKLKLAGAYQEQLSENLRRKQALQAELEARISEARATGQYELASALEAQAQNVLAQKIALEKDLYAGDMNNIASAENIRQWKEQMDFTKREAELAREEARRKETASAVRVSSVKPVEDISWIYDEISASGMKPGEWLEYNADTYGLSDTMKRQIMSNYSQKGIPSGNGPYYGQAYSAVGRMIKEGASREKIENYLDSFEEDELTPIGVAQILATFGI